MKPTQSTVIAILRAQAGPVGPMKIAAYLPDTFDPWDTFRIAGVCESLVSAGDVQRVTAGPSTFYQLASV